MNQTKKIRTVANPAEVINSLSEEYSDVLDMVLAAT
jgi:hypothetical protein